MRTVRVAAVITFTVASALLPRPVLAQFNEPGTAKAVKVSVVTAYEPCSTPNTVTSDLTPACTAVRSDSYCGFEGAGHGLMYFRTKGSTGWAVKIVILNLGDNCKGETIRFYGTLRTTTNDCGAGSPCTVDTPNVELGSCIVSHSGFCGLSTPVFQIPPIISKAGGTQMTDLKGVRVTGPGAPATTLRHGLVTAFGS